MNKRVIVLILALLRIEFTCIALVNDINEPEKAHANGTFTMQPLDRYPTGNQGNISNLPEQDKSVTDAPKIVPVNEFKKTNNINDAF